MCSIHIDFQALNYNFFSHPRPGPDVGAELEDGHLEHEVDAGDELRGAGQRVHGGPRQVQVVVGPPVPAYPHACKKKKMNEIITLY